MWKLVIEDDEGKRTVVPLTRDDYSIGRKEGNTIRLTERNVSRAHAKLSRKNGVPQPAMERLTYVLEDLTSYNGVYVNGLRVSHAQELAHGDLIQIGDYRIVLQDDAVAEAPATAVPASSDLKQTVPIAPRASLLMERPNRLVMLAGPTPGAEYSLETERLTIGRAEDATISINHNSVSRLHCEIHALGDGRFEIVDKGSSNGVRVNGAELRRGIVEAGDVIELGDVKFRFVGAGQVFRPGVTESQQLNAIGDRAAAAIVGAPRRRTFNALPFLVVFAVAGACAAVAWAFTRSQNTPNPTPTPSTSLLEIDPKDQALLDTAKGLCQHPQVQCDDAIEKLKAISKDSPLRTSQPAHDVAGNWADWMFARAITEKDNARSLYADVYSTEFVPEDKRSKAADFLRELDSKAETPVSELPKAREAGADAATPTKPDAGHKLFVWDAGGVAANTTIKPTASPPPTETTPPDPNEAANRTKRALFGKCAGGSCTAAELKILKGVCLDTKDRGCVDMANQRLLDKQPKPPNAP